MLKSLARKVIFLYLQTYLQATQHTYLTYLQANQPTYLQANQTTNLPTYKPTNQPTYQPTNQPTYCDGMENNLKVICELEDQNKG